MNDDWQKVLNFIFSILSLFFSGGVGGRMMWVWWKNRQLNHTNAYSLTLQQNQRMSQDYWERLERDAKKLERLEQRENHLSSQVVAMSNQLYNLKEDFEQVIKERNELIVKNEDSTQKYSEELQKFRDCIKRQDETIAKQSNKIKQQDNRIKQQDETIAKQSQKIQKLERAFSIWQKLINLLPQNNDEVDRFVNELNAIFGDDNDR